MISAASRARSHREKLVLPVLFILVFIWFGAAVLHNNPIESANRASSVTGRTVGPAQWCRSARRTSIVQPVALHTDEDDSC